MQTQCHINIALQMCILLFVGLKTLKKLLEDPLYSKGFFFNS